MALLLGSVNSNLVLQFIYWDFPIYIVKILSLLQFFKYSALFSFWDLVCLGNYNLSFLPEPSAVSSWFTNFSPELQGI